MYIKPNNNPLYANANSNEPPNMLERLHIRLLSLSIHKDEFDKAKPLCKKALKSSGFNKNLKSESIQEKSLRNRKIKVVWFNSPYNALVKSKIDKVFLKPVQKHFHKPNRYKKIFNNNTIKLSYSHTLNVKNLIKQHNTSIMKSGKIQTKIIATVQTRIIAL